MRKVGLPLQPELGVGAVGEDRAQVFNLGLLSDLRLEPHDLHEVTTRESEEVRRRVERYRGDRPAVDVADRTVILVDDGIATGFTVRTAVEIVRQRGAARVVVAVPVGAEAAIRELRASPTR